MPVVHLLETPEIAEELIPEILREIPERHWQVVLQVLVEAKFKAEAMLRDDSVMISHGRMAYFQGWVAFADYAISNLDSLRSRQNAERPEAAPGPD